MKPGRALAAAAVTATLTMPAVTATDTAAAATSGGTLVRLDTAGAVSGLPRAINNVGTTVGRLEFGDYSEERRAVVWQGRIVVARPAGDLESEALDVNDDGLVVGYLLDGRVGRAFEWRAGSLQRLPGLPNSAGESANAVNDGGLVVGVAHSAGGPNQAVFWRNGQLGRVPPPPGYNGGTAIAVNDAGAIAGILNGGVGGRPTKGFVWSDGKLRVLNGLAPSSSVQVAGIDDLGRVYGASTTAAGRFHAIRIDPDGRVHDFGELPGGGTSEVLGVSARGDVVGFAEQPNPGSQYVFRAVVAHPRGTLLVLPGLGRPGRGSDTATDINDQGDAVGTSRPAGAYHNVPVLWRCVFGQAQRP